MLLGEVVANQLQCCNRAPHESARTLRRVIAQPRPNQSLPVRGRVKSPRARAALAGFAALKTAAGPLDGRTYQV